MPALPGRLEKEHAALIVIDLQERFRGIIDNLPRVTANCSRLIRFCQRLGIPMLVTEHYPQGLGATLPELRRLFDPFEALEKITFSCAGDEGFRNAVQALDRRQLILCGIETHVCVYQTARDLLDEGQQVFLAADAVSSRTVTDRELGLNRLRDLGIPLMSTEMILFEILKVAKTDDFKAVADILKDLLSARRTAHFGAILRRRATRSDI